MIKTVDENNIDIAAHIHSEAWQESHKSFCNPVFVAKHKPEHQKEYLLEKIRNGTALYMLFDESSEKDVGIVSVTENLIEDLYILPSEQNKGLWHDSVEICLQQMLRCPNTLDFGEQFKCSPLVSEERFF